MSKKVKLSRSEKQINGLNHLIRMHYTKFGKNPKIIKNKMIFDESFSILSVKLNDEELELFKKYVVNEK